MKSIIDKLKDKADRNDDGKVSKADLEHMRNSSNSGLIDSLKAKADVNNDGGLSMEDIKSLVR